MLQFVPKLMFWCVLYRLVYLRPFGCLTKLEAKRSDLVQNFMPWSRVGIFCNKSTRSTPWDPKLMFWCISYHLDPFGTVRLPYETQGKTGRTSAKICTTKLNWNFSRRRTRSTPYDPKLMFWCVSNHLGAFGTVRLPYKTRGKTGRMCKSSCHEVA